MNRNIIHSLSTVLSKLCFAICLSFSSRTNEWTFIIFHGFFSPVATDLLKVPRNITTERKLVKCCCYQ